MLTTLRESRRVVCRCPARTRVVLTGGQSTRSESA